MEKYKVVFMGTHIGNLTVTEEGYEYHVIQAAVDEIKEKYPVFDALKTDMKAKCIPFFKVRLEHNVDKYETDDYRLEKM